MHSQNFKGNDIGENEAIELDLVVNDVEADTRGQGEGQEPVHDEQELEMPMY